MNRITFRKELPPITTIVVKTGSRIVATSGSASRIDQLATDLAALRQSGIRIVLVSSGAIAHGMKAFGMTTRPATMPLKQACASVGQNRLMNMYQAIFEKKNILIGQVLLTWDDLRSKKRYLNLRNTMFQLLEHGVIPIVNENDSVGTEEIRFGTNDILSAQVALLVQAELLVNLTDVRGLFDRNPHEDSAAKQIPIVSGHSETVLGLAHDLKNETSVGGMTSKLKATDMVSRAGIFTLIGDGFNHRLLEVLTDDNCATLFTPVRRKMSSRHQWIAFAGHSAGELVVDRGAQQAIIEKGKSLLPAGVREAKGLFKAGSAVDIRSIEGTVFARGLVNYSADEIRSIKGCKSSEIMARLGSKEFDEVVHRDNLVVL